MLELKKGIDILAQVGGIKTLDEANDLFAGRCDRTDLAKLAKIANEQALLKIANAIAVTDPDAVLLSLYWVTPPNALSLGTSTEKAFSFNFLAI